LDILTSKDTPVYYSVLTKEDIYSGKEPQFIDINHEELKGENAMVKEFSKASIFKFTSRDTFKTMTNMVYGQLKKSYRPSIPFSNIYVEFPDGFQCGVDNNTEISAFWLHTEDDSRYEYISLVKTKIIRKLHCGTFHIDEMKHAYNITGNKEYGSYRVISHPSVNPFALSHLFCAILESCKTATIDMGFTYKEQKPKSKKTKTIHGKTSVTYIAPKTGPIENFKGLGDSIEWSYQFKRRGHFRKIKKDSLGKNRASEYIIWGETWVKECVINKNKNLPELKQIRVIK